MASSFRSKLPDGWWCAVHAPSTAFFLSPELPTNTNAPRVSLRDVMIAIMNDQSPKDVKDKWIW